MNEEQRRAQMEEEFSIVKEAVLPAMTDLAQRLGTSLAEAIALYGVYLEQQRMMYQYRTYVETREFYTGQQERQQRLDAYMQKAERHMDEDKGEGWRG